MTTTPGSASRNLPGKPPVVDLATWQAARQELLVREKAHTREGDALAGARDEKAPRGIRHSIAAGITATVAATAGLAFSPGPLSLGLTLLLFYITIIALIFGWIPRVTARRMAAELAEDPGGFERHRRERRMQLLAAVLGFLLSVGAVFLDFMLSGGKQGDV